MDVRAHFGASRRASIVRPERSALASNQELRMREWREASVIPIGSGFCQHVFGRFGRTLPFVDSPAIQIFCFRRRTPDV